MPEAEAGTAASRLLVRDLTKSFGGRDVVRDLSLEVHAGEVVGLVGPNGAGKTTVLNAVLGTDPPDRGEVLLDGDPLDERRPAVRRSVAAVMDDMGWFPDVTAAEHLDLLARSHGERHPQQLVDEALETLGIAHVADHVPTALSSGQRRRLALATTLVRPFRLLVLDEPEQRLDVDGRTWLAGHLRRAADDGAGVLLASHDEALLAGARARCVTIAEIS